MARPALACEIILRSMIAACKRISPMIHRYSNMAKTVDQIR